MKKVFTKGFFFLLLLGFFSVSAEETLPGRFVEMLRSCRVGPNKVFLGGKKFVYTADAEMPQPEPVEYAFKTAQWIGWDNGVIFSKVALIPESQELRIEGRVIGTNAGGARSGVSVFIGKESTLKVEMIPSAQAITDPEGWFAVQGKVESGDRLYICEVKRPVKEYALGEFVEELEAFYRVVPKKSLNQHPLDGRWIIEMGEPHFLKGRYEFSPYWVYLVELEIKDNQIGGHTIPPKGHLELKIHGEVSKKGISVVFTNLGVVDSKGFVDPFGGTQVNLILKGELHRYTLRGSWEDTNNGEKTAGKWIAFRVKEEGEQDANSLSGKP